MRGEARRPLIGDNGARRLSDVPGVLLPPLREQHELPFGEICVAEPSVDRRSCDGTGVELENLAPEREAR